MKKSTKDYLQAQLRYAYWILNVLCVVALGLFGYGFIQPVQGHCSFENWKPLPNGTTLGGLTMYPDKSDCSFSVPFSAILAYGKGHNDGEGFQEDLVKAYPGAYCEAYAHSSAQKYPSYYCTDKSEAIIK